MRLVGLLLCCLVVSAQTCAQELRFQATPVTDEAGLSRSIRDLALAALSQLQASEQGTGPGDRFLLQLGAEQYAEATNTLAGASTLHPAQAFDRDVLLRLFAKTKAAAATQHVPFEGRLREYLRDGFSRDG